MIEYRSTDGSFDDVEVARLVVVNYASNQSRCYVCLNLPELRGRTVRLEDLMGPASYERDGNDLLFARPLSRHTAVGYHVFEMSVNG